MSKLEIDLNNPFIIIPTIIFAYVIIILMVAYLYAKLPSDKKKSFTSFVLRLTKGVSAVSSLVLLFDDEKNNGKFHLRKRVTYTHRRVGRRNNSIIKKNTNKLERSPNLMELVDKEFSNANLVRNVFINVFVIFTLCIICTYLWLDKISVDTKIVLGVSYISFSLFNIFIIKSSYRRTAMLLSIMEDSKKQEDIGNFINKHRSEKGLSDNDIELIRLMYISRAEREKSVEHPYELFLKNVNGATINFGKGSIKVDGEKTKDC